MKTLILTLIVSLTNLLSFGQINIDDFYKNRSEYLIYEEVQTFETLSSIELQTKIKNWGSTAFNNLNEVLVGETSEQMVFNYVSQSLYRESMGRASRIGWYIRLVVQIKEGKIRMLFYDDGNVRTAGYVAGNTYVPGTPARTDNLDVYFNNEGVSRKKYTDGLENLKLSCQGIALDLVSSVNSNKTNGW